MPGPGGHADAIRREAAQLLKLATPSLDHETTKTRIVRAAKALGWNFDRTRRIWFGEAARIEAHEMDQLRFYALEAAQRLARK
jgi:hypothetical protein